MNFRKFALTVGFGFVSGLMVGTSTANAQKSQASLGSETSRIGAMTGHATDGKNLYDRFCIGCHGADGKGQGKDALKIGAKPRDFTKAKFKCRSTPTGTLPTDEDLFNTITRGMANTSMKPWASLTAQNRADLVAYIKTFSSLWKSEGSGAPISIPKETTATPEGVERGKVLFQTKLQCAKCHGKEGAGDGPNGAKLEDDDGRSIKPHDFTHGSRFECGATDDDLYRIIMTGLDGTPMTSWAEYLDGNQAWDLVHYLRTLQHLGSTPSDHVGPKNEKKKL